MDFKVGDNVFYADVTRVGERGENGTIEKIGRIYITLSDGTQFNKNTLKSKYGETLFRSKEACIAWHSCRGREFRIIDFLRDHDVGFEKIMEIESILFKEVR